MEEHGYSQLERMHPPTYKGRYNIMNKVEIFKDYFASLINREDYQKATQFKQFLYDYFARKGQKTEYVYCLCLDIVPIHKITDSMLDSIE